MKFANLIAITCIAALAGCASGPQGGSEPTRAAYEGLEGAQASSADGSLRNMGFRDVDQSRSGDAIYVIWYNSRSRECLEMEVVDGTVVNLTEIRDHPEC